MINVPGLFVYTHIVPCHIQTIEQRKAWINACRMSRKKMMALLTPDLTCHLESSSTFLSMGAQDYKVTDSMF